jgi:Ca2+-binding RTX toxin-like protein
VQTAQGPGAGDQTFTYFDIRIVPTIYNDSSPGTAKPAEIVDVAELFGQQYTGVLSPDGCHQIASTIAAAAGAPLPYLSGDLDPGKNRDGGLWTVVHRGDENPTPNWTNLLNPGDIIRFDYADGSKDQHTLVVLSVAGNSIETVDNVGANGTIHHHTWAPAADPSTVTIYRITSTFHLLEGGAAHDRLFGSIFQDELQGWNGNDALLGGDGNDIVDGGNGNDSLGGGKGKDKVFGDAGNDVINGGLGKDKLQGGADDDTFVFNTSPLGKSRDTVLDFTPADDVIHLENGVFGALTATGTLSGAAFRIGSAAADADDRIIYNKGSGALLYDPDGSGKAGAVQFGLLDDGLNLSNADFIVI